MVAGLEDISSGELYIDDKLVNDVEPKKRDIAMVFQSYALYPHMTVYKNMAFALRLKHLPKAEVDEKIKQVADILGLTDYLKRKPKELSGGQKQRVALGRAIVRNPKVFLMDEPLSNLDAKLRVQMRTEIKKIHERVGATTIYVTHDQTEAMTMADRVVVMKDGWVQQIGTPSEIYSNPNNVFVSTFIGAPSMNILEATYDKGAVKFENGDEVKLPNSLIQKHEHYYQELKPKLIQKIESLEKELEEIGELVKNDFKYRHGKSEEEKENYFESDQDIIDIKKELEDARKQLDNCELVLNKKAHPILVGIRPEDIAINIDPNKQYSDQINIEYDTSELLGKEFIIYGYLGAQKLSVNTSQVAVSQDIDNIKYYFKLEKLYLFDFFNKMAIK
jgi:ABC-type sugar transport system ATPase subunit